MIVVNVGELLECDESDEIATRGCDPCVALIVIYNNGIGDHGSQYIKRCAHFSVDIKLPMGAKQASGRQQLVQAALDPVLNAHFPLKNVRRVGFSTGGFSRNLGAEEIVTRLRSYFQEQRFMEWAKCDSLRSHNDMIMGAKGQIWPFTHENPANSNAELRGRDQPLDEKAQ